jgi:hypothetical protein
MSQSANNGSLAELSLVKVYMDLTGSTESQARGVFMHICREEDGAPPTNRNGMSPLSFAASNHVTMAAVKRVKEAAPGWTKFRASVVPAGSGV